MKKEKPECCCSRNINGGASLQLVEYWIHERITRASHSAGGVRFFHHVQRKNHIEGLELRRKLEDPCNNLCCRDVPPPHPSCVTELP